MQFMRLKHWAVFLFAMLFVLSAQAREFYVDITNNTGYTIMYLYVSPDNSESWEKDVLGNDVMPNGSTKRVTLKGYKSPIFDIKLVDSDGDSYTFWDVDVSRRDLTVTLDDLD